MVVLINEEALHIQKKEGYKGERGSNCEAERESVAYIWDEDDTSPVDSQSTPPPSLSLPHHPCRRHVGESDARWPEKQGRPCIEPRNCGGVGQYELYQGLPVPALLHGTGGDDAALCRA